MAKYQVTLTIDDSCEEITSYSIQNYMAEVYDYVTIDKFEKVSIDSDEAIKLMKKIMKCDDYTNTDVIIRQFHDIINKVAWVSYIMCH